MPCVEGKRRRPSLGANMIHDRFKMFERRLGPYCICRPADLQCSDDLFPPSSTVYAAVGRPVTRAAWTAVSACH